MLFLEDCEKVDIKEFPGAVSLTDEALGEGAIVARNVDFRPGEVRTARGFTLVFTPATTPYARLLYHWLLPNDLSRLIYFDGSAFYSRDLSGVTNQLVVTLAAHGAVVAQSGTRLYLAYYDGSGLGAAQVRIWRGTVTAGTADVDLAFQRGLKTTEMTLAVIDTGTGVVTAGTRRFLVIFEAQNGYETQPSPIPSATSYTQQIAAGGKQLQVTVTPATTWPSWVNKVKVLMTTAQNTARYYKVPGAVATLTPGGAGAAVITINIDDVTLAGTGVNAGTDATEYFNLLAQTDAGAGPFSPHFIGGYSNRMVYLIREQDPALASQYVAKAYVSEQYAPQWITADQHFIQLPGFRDMVAFFVLGRSIYWLGPGWTYSSSDNNGKPVTWAAPELVDGHIGTTVPGGFSVNVAKGWAWVADRGGLFLFRGGSYEPRPISFYQRDEWTSIKWITRNSIQVLDDAANNRVWVLSLNVTTGLPQIFRWDYGEGITPEKAKFDVRTFAPATYQARSIASVQHYGSKRQEVWIGTEDISPAGPGAPVLRQKGSPPEDALPFNDNGSGIDSQYRTGPPLTSPGLLHWHAAHLSLTGNGTVDLAAYARRQGRNVTLGSASLTADAQYDLLRLFALDSEACSINISNGAVANSYFELSHGRLYFTRGFSKG